MELNLIKDTQNKAWAKDKSNFGFRMLSKMGWKEGKGLGKNQDGMTTHIRVERREESRGLGVLNDNTGDNTLSKGFATYKGILAALSSHHNKTVATESVETSVTVTSSKKAKKAKKSKSSEKKKRSKGSDACDAEVEATTTTVVRTGRRLTYHKYLKNKNARGYSAKDMSAILGIAHAENARRDGTSAEDGFTVTPEGDLTRDSSTTNSRLSYTFDGSVALKKDDSSTSSQNGHETSTAVMSSTMASTIMTNLPEEDASPSGDPASDVSATPINTLTKSEKKAKKTKKRKAEKSDTKIKSSKKKKSRKSE